VQGDKASQAPRSPTVNCLNRLLQEFDEEQVLVARLLHQLSSPDAGEHVRILKVAQSRLVQGGPRRVRHTLPALAFCGLQLARRSGAAKGDAGVGMEALLQWLHQVRPRFGSCHSCRGPRQFQVE
jgi:hypothetical protein